MTLHPLDEQCGECKGVGTVGGVRTTSYWESARQCPRCHGAKRAPTADGLAVLEFLRLHGFVLR